MRANTANSEIPIERYFKEHHSESKEIKQEMALLQMICCAELKIFEESGNNLRNAKMSIPRISFYRHGILRSWFSNSSIELNQESFSLPISVGQGVVEKLTEKLIKQGELERDSSVEKLRRYVMTLQGFQRLKSAGTLSDFNPELLEVYESRLIQEQPFAPLVAGGEQARENSVTFTPAEIQAAIGKVLPSGSSRLQQNILAELNAMHEKKQAFK